MPWTFNIQSCRSWLEKQNFRSPKKTYRIHICILTSPAQGKDTAPFLKCFPPASLWGWFPMATRFSWNPMSTTICMESLTNISNKQSTALESIPQPIGRRVHVYSHWVCFSSVKCKGLKSEEPLEADRAWHGAGCWPCVWEDSTSRGWACCCWGWRKPSTPFQDPHPWPRGQGPPWLYSPHTGHHLEEAPRGWVTREDSFLFNLETHMAYFVATIAWVGSMGRNQPKN